MLVPSLGGDPNINVGKGTLTRRDHDMDKGGSTFLVDFKSNFGKGTENTSIELEVGRDVA
jgi:hypothetical protein